MKKVLIHGAYSGNNFGDTLLLKLLVDELTQKGVTVYLNNVCDQTFEYFTGNKFVFRVNNIFGLVKVDALIYGGGGYFSEQPTEKFKWYLRFLKNHIFIGLLFLILKKPISFIAVEFGPIKNFFVLKLVQKILAHSKLICARNQKSYEWILHNSNNENAFLTADLALLINQALPQKNNIQAKIDSIRLFIHPSYPVSYSRLNEKLAAMLFEFAKSKPGIEIYILCDKQFKETEMIIDSWKKALNVKQNKIIKYSYPIEFCERIKECDYIISNKLHTLIVAAAFGKKIISIAKHPKNNSFFEDLGYDRVVVPFDDNSTKELEQIFNRLHRGELQNIFVSKTIHQRALSNFNYLNDFIKSL